MVPPAVPLEGCDFCSCLMDQVTPLLETFWKLSVVGRIKPKLLTLASKLYIISALTAPSVAPSPSRKLWTWLLVLKHTKKFLPTLGIFHAFPPAESFLWPLCDWLLSSFTPHQDVTSTGRPSLTTLSEVGSLFFPVILCPISHYNLSLFLYSLH